MTLGEYVAKHGVSVKKTLQLATGLRWQTIHEIAEGRTTPQMLTAKKLVAATGGACSLCDLLGVSPSELLGDSAA